MYQFNDRAVLNFSMNDVEEFLTGMCQHPVNNVRSRQLETIRNKRCYDECPKGKC